MKMPVAFTPGPDDMLGCYLGVHGTTIGEDGAWLLLGHIDPRRAIVVMRKIGHLELGLDDEDIFGWLNPLEPLTARVEHRVGLFERHPEGCQCTEASWLPEEGPERYCVVAQESDIDGWWCDYSDAARANPAAVPVTTWRP